MPSMIRMGKNHEAAYEMDSHKCFQLYLCALYDLPLCTAKIDLKYKSLDVKQKEMAALNVFSFSAN